MPFAFMLALAAVAGATTLTYLYDRDAAIWSRLCAGVCLGFAMLGLVGFVLASFAGMTPLALTLAGAVGASPLLLLSREDLRRRLSADIVQSARAARQAVARPGKRQAGALIVFVIAGLFFWFVLGSVPAYLFFYFLASVFFWFVFSRAPYHVFFYALAALLFWFVFAHAMYETPAGIFTGVDTNIGDLPFHIAVINSFAYGDNFPPQHPEFAGVRLTYPFVVDFVTAMFVRAGASLEGAMFWQNFAMIMSLIGLMHRWALKLTRDRVAALMTPAIVLLGGGFGWWIFIGEAAKGEGVFALLGNLRHDYTIMGHIGYQWGNAVTALFVTQRSILLGVALAVVVLTLWWQASEKAKVKREKAKDEGEEASVAASKAERRDVGKKASVGKRAERKKVKGKAARGDASKQSEDATRTGDFSFAFCHSPFAFRQMFAAGVVAGLLPLVHAHTFVVVMLMGACLALMQGASVLLLKDDASEDEATRAPSPAEAARAGSLSKLWAVLLPWLIFAAVASALALPQMFWATRESAVRAGQFFGWEFGWAHGDENVAWFWLKNTGFFIPLLVVALAWRGREPLVSRRLLFFFLPFVLCFVVPNVYKLSPWVWDNIKVLFYWWLASAPLVALVLARLWRMKAAWKALAVALLLMQTAAGALDVWRAAAGSTERQTFDAAGMAFAEVVKSRTAPRALILHAPTYNDPVYMSGRRTFLGYPGHVWSHGIDYSAREDELKSIYAGSTEAQSLIAKEGIEYVVVGPLERDEMKQRGVALNESFFARFAKVGEAGGYIIYKTKP
ncbi:MAG TPA: hypothetical protein VLJ61_07420 [Pyrinomonadaceae bacterium]|nr:hypothetical protein [Pyrinomonadaceae bacterium]